MLSSTSPFNSLGESELISFGVVLRLIERKCWRAWDIRISMLGIWIMVSPKKGADEREREKS